MQAVGVGDMCVPVNVNPVVLWSNTAVVQLTVVWHVEHLAKANDGPDVECTGVVVPCQVVKWQVEFPQSVGAVVKL
jgi:hypothetical protein